jgi:hypothetical protein
MGNIRFSKESARAGNRSTHSSVPASSTKNLPGAQIYYYNSISMISAASGASRALGNICSSKESSWVGNRSICSSAPVSGAQNHPSAQLSAYNSISRSSAPFLASMAPGTSNFSKESVWGGNRSVSLHTRNSDAPNDPSALFICLNSLPLNFGPVTAILHAGNTSFTDSAGLGNRSISPHIWNSDTFYDNNKMYIARVPHSGTS